MNQFRLLGLSLFPGGGGGSSIDAGVSFSKRLPPLLPLVSGIDRQNKERLVLTYIHKQHITSYMNFLLLL